MRWRRSVTLAPMTMPSRSLKFATLFLAGQSAGFWPVIFSRSSTTDFCVSLSTMPNAMLTTILERRGTSMGFLKPNFSRRAGTTVSS